MTNLEQAIDDLVQSRVEQAVAHAMAAYVAPVKENPTMSAYEAYEYIHGHEGSPAAVSKYMGDLVRKKKLRKIVVSDKKARYWREDVIAFMEERTVTGRHA